MHIDSSGGKIGFLASRNSARIACFDLDVRQGTVILMFHTVVPSL